MTVTHQSLRFKCSVQDCPWPKDEEIHAPWCLRIPDVPHSPEKGHQHFPKKGMGGKNPKSKIVAILCNYCHDNIDNGEWGNDVKEMPGRGRVYFAWDLHGKTLIERLVLSAAAEGESGRQEPLGSAEVPEPLEARSGPSVAAPSAGSKEESDGAGRNRTRNPKGVSDGQGDRSAEAADVASAVSGGIRGDGGAEHRPPPLTHEQRVAIAQEIKDSEWQRQWRAGDTGNQWIAELGEEAEQYLSDFGYVHESLANILRVCAAIPAPYRNGNLRFSHHVVVAKLNREDMEMWLGECEENQWSVATFREAVHGPRASVPRWTAESLLEEVESWPAPRERLRPRGAVKAFIQHLEEQG